jgi:hypothetical protein
MPERIWTLDLVVALIAWLDYCVRFAEDFDATVVKILEDHRKDRNEEVITFTLLQIDNKLIDLSRTNRVPKDQSNHPKLREVKQRGSKCFPGLKHEIREQVKKYAATWKKRQNQLRVVHKLRRHKDTDLENSEPASSSSCNVSKQSKKDTRMARKDEDCRDINKVCYWLSSVEGLFDNFKRHNPLTNHSQSLSHGLPSQERIMRISLFAIIVDK